MVCVGGGGGWGGVLGNGVEWAGSVSSHQPVSKTDRSETALTIQLKQISFSPLFRDVIYLAV